MLKHTNPNFRPDFGSELPASFDASKPLRRPKWERFAQEYIKDFNATQAAKRAGYNPRLKKSRQAYSHILVHHPEILARIHYLVEEEHKAMCVTDERISAELARVGFANMSDMIQFDAHGEPYISLKGLTRDQWAALSEVQIEDCGSTRSKRNKKVKVKQYDKLSALEKLAKIRGLFQLDNAQGAANVAPTVIINGPHDTQCEPDS